MRKAFFCLLGTLLLAPALPAAPRDPEWIEARSPNFTVITDAGAKKGREVALRFEQLRAVFGVLTGKQRVTTPVPLQILAFRRGKDFSQIAPLFNGRPIKLAGLFVGGADRNFIALDLSQPDPWRVVYHEYAHMLLDANYQRTQPWFDEGFAGYYESLEVSGKSAAVGKDPARYGPMLSDGRWMPLGELFAVTQQSRDYNEGDRRGVFYAQSWLMVHYLFDLRKMQEISRYFGLVLKEHVPIPQAIQQAFGMSLAELERDLKDYFRSNRAIYYTLDTPAELTELAFEVRPLDALDARAAIGDLRLHHRDYQDAAAEDFKTVLAARPDHAVANRGLGYHYMHKRDFGKAAEHFRRAAAANLADPQVLYYLGMLAPASGRMGPEAIAEMKQALTKAIELKPDFADAYNLLAFAHGAAQEYEAAAEAMKKAVALAPREEKYTDALARYYLRLEKWDDAEALLKTLASSSDAAMASGAQRELQSLRDVRARRSPGGAPAAGLRMRSSTEGRAEEFVEPQPEPVPPAQPIKFLKGTLLDVSCADTGGAVLRVQGKDRMWTMLAADAKKMIVIGANTLDCGWKQKKVAVNYREKGDAEEIISLELQEQ